MTVDLNAPLTGRQEILIDAPIERVWEMQTDIENWPKWQKEVTFAKLDGDLRPGTTFKWKAMGVNITSVLQEVVENESIGWSGRSIGMRAAHIWRFERQGNGTKVITEESLSGWLPRLIKLFKPEFLDESLSKALRTLKYQVGKPANR